MSTLWQCSLTHAVVPYRLRPPQTSTTLRMGGRKGEVVSARKWLPFYSSSKAQASRGQLMNRAATISDRSLLLMGSATKLRY